MKSSVLLRLPSSTKNHPTWDKEMLASFKLISQSHFDYDPSIGGNQASTDSCGVHFQGHGKAVFQNSCTPVVETFSHIHLQNV